MTIYIEAFEQIIGGLPTTMSLTILSVLLALILGILLSFGKGCRIRIVKGFFSVLSSFLKGIPILVFLYALSSSIDTIMGGLDSLLPFYTYDIRKPPTFAFAVIAIAISYAPYMCDMILTAIRTVPKGQWEACDAAGFTSWQKMSRIIIPQSVVIAIPNFGNHFVNLMKATSLSCMVTIMEIMGESRNFATLSQKFLQSYIVCALVYWVIFILFEQIFRVVEKKTGFYLEPSVPIQKKHFRFRLKVEGGYKSI